jgi:hypothetical protein
MHPCIDFRFATLYDKHLAIMCWISINLFTICLIYSRPLLQQDRASCYKMIRSSNQHDVIWNQSFIWMHPHILSLLALKVPIFMATQFLSLPFYNSDRVLEGPPSIMGSQLPALSCKHAFLQCIQFKVLLMSTFVSNHSWWVNVPKTLFVHEFSCKNLNHPWLT